LRTGKKDHFMGEPTFKKMTVGKKPDGKETPRLGKDRTEEEAELRVKKGVLFFGKPKTPHNPPYVTPKVGRLFWPSIKKEPAGKRIRVR